MKIIPPLFKYINGYRHTHFIIYFILSIFILDNFRLPGYFLTLDMIFGPNYFDTTQFYYGFNEYIFIGTPLFIFLDTVSHLINIPNIQRILLVLVLFLSGVSAHNIMPCESKLGKYFAGLMYMINPFIYIRFLAGNFLILLGYSAMPFAAKLAIDLLEKQNLKTTIKLAFLITLIAILSIHILFLLIFFLAILFIFRFLNIDSYSERKILLKFFLLLSVFFILLNFHWLLTSITAKVTTINQITQSDISIFTTKQDLNFNTLFTTASMYGFWRAGYVYTKDLLPYWYLFFIFILFLAVHGFVSNYKHSKHGVYVKAFGAMAVLSVLLAAGISGPFAGVFEFLFNNVFFFKGFREPQKFVALLVLAYAYLGGLGVAEFEKMARAKGTLQGAGAVERYKTIAAWAIIALALATPFIYSFTMFNGFWGQLKPTDYPKDWYEVNEFLDQDEQDFNILFLPWHAYMDFKWLPNAQKRLANPAYIFFDKPVIQGDNMEVAGIYSSSTNPVSRYIEFLLAKRNEINNFGGLVAPLNIKYVILTKEVDYKLYDFLYNQSDLELVKDTENLVVFRNKHPVAKFYQVDGISTIKSWEDLLELSKSIDITSSAFVLGNSVEIMASEGQALNFSKKSPVKYELEKPSRRYIVYSEKYSSDWKLGGNAPVANFGVTNVYDTSEIKGLTLYYERFNVYLAGYIISGVSFVFLLVLYFRERRKANDTDP